ncbi:MAG: XisI protein [Acidobacteria bacterium]|nr:XisI protein [Acidobacteriota bacterium]MBI3422149.1 XisI protein [Acidobacteriota bacterium]
MDQLTKYRELIKQILTEYVTLTKRTKTTGPESQLLMDDVRGHYMWLKLGWEKGRRVQYITVYVRLCDGKLWIEEDWTEDGIATELLRAGVPQEDIVLAFNAPDSRSQTESVAA